MPHRLPTPPQGLRFTPVGQKAAGTKADEACGQRMQQKPLDKDVSSYLPGLESVTLLPIAGGKAAASVTDITNAVVRDGHPMGRAAAILQDLLRPGKGPLGVHDPILGVEPIHEAWEARGGPEFLRLLPPDEVLLCVGLPQGGEKLATKDLAQGLNRQETVRVAWHPGRPLGGEGATRHQGVVVELRLSHLVPGVQDQDGAHLAAQVVTTNRKQGLPRSPKQQAQQETLSAQAQRVELMR